MVICSTVCSGPDAVSVTCSFLPLMVKQIRVPFCLPTESCLSHDEGHGAATCGWASFGGLRDVGALRNVSSALRTLPMLVGIAKSCVPLLHTWPFPVSALICFPAVLTPGSVFPLGLSWSKLEHLCLTPAEIKGRGGCFLTLTCFCSGDQTAEKSQTEAVQPHLHSEVDKPPDLCAAFCPWGCLLGLFGTRHSSGHPSITRSLAVCRLRASSAEEMGSVKPNPPCR